MAGRALVRNNKRLGFRVQIADLPEHVQREITAEITSVDGAAPATLVDLSLSGMLVTDLHMAVKVGDLVSVALQYDGRAVSLLGAVVREVEHGSVGIRFPESIRDGEFDPPVPLSNLHRKLERIWLQSREK